MSYAVAALSFGSALALAMAADPVRAACYPESAQAAETAANSARNWVALHKAFVRFGVCDDGGVAEGFSGSVARVLTEHWESVTTLDHLAAQDPKFGHFVLRHVDTLMTPDQARTIGQSARDNCPRGSRALCASIVERIGEAAKE